MFSSSCALTFSICDTFSFTIAERVAISAFKNAIVASCFSFLRCSLRKSERRENEARENTKPLSQSSYRHVYEVRPRKDKRGSDLISDVLPLVGPVMVDRTQPIRNQKITAPTPIGVKGGCSPQNILKSQQDRCHPSLPRKQRLVSAVVCRIYLQLCIIC